MAALSKIPKRDEILDDFKCAACRNVIIVGRYIDNTETEECEKGMDMRNGHSPSSCDRIANLFFLYLSIFVLYCRASCDRIANLFFLYCKAEAMSKIKRCDRIANLFFLYLPLTP